MTPQATHQQPLRRGTLVLVPGLLCDDWTWHGQREALERDWTVVIPDLTHLDSVTAMAEALLGMMPPRFMLAGHSLGGRIALEAYRQAPERIDRLALLDTGVHAAGAAEPASRGRLLTVARQEGMAALAAQWLPGMVLETRTDDLDLMTPLIEMVCRSTPERFANQVAALLTRPDATPVLQRITCPTAILCGRQDRWSPLERHRSMAATVPGAALEIIEESGHMTPVEQPTAVTEALRRWLAD